MFSKYLLCKEVVQRGRGRGIFDDNLSHDSVRAAGPTTPSISRPSNLTTTNESFGFRQLLACWWNKRWTCSQRMTIRFEASRNCVRHTPMERQNRWSNHGQRWASVFSLLNLKSKFSPCRKGASSLARAQRSKARQTCKQ